MTTTTEIMALAERYADSVLRVSTGQTNKPESIAAAARQALQSAIEALVRDGEKAKEALRDAFTEGYFARSTYNDVETSDCDTEWGKYIAAQKVKP